jgi:uncharacterized membrane protein
LVVKALVLTFIQNPMRVLWLYWFKCIRRVPSHYFSALPIYRVQQEAILIVTAVVASFSYFLVTVIPGIAIVTRVSRFWLITIVAALSAMALVVDGVNRSDVSVAFAGGVLGTTIGADLLHLKDVRPEIAATPLSIGGAGLDDGIAQCGLCALIIAEWLPATMAWLSACFR